MPGLVEGLAKVRAARRSLRRRNVLAGGREILFSLERPEASNEYRLQLADPDPRVWNDALVSLGVKLSLAPRVSQTRSQLARLDKVVLFPVLDQLAERLEASGQTQDAARVLSIWRELSGI